MLADTYSDYDLAAYSDLWDDPDERRNLLIGVGVGAVAGAVYPLGYLGYSRPMTAVAGAVAGALVALLVNSYGD